MNGILLSEITDLHQPFTFDKLGQALNSVWVLPFACGLLIGVISGIIAACIILSARPEV